MDNKIICLAFPLERNAVFILLSFILFYSSPEENTLYSKAVHYTSITAKILWIVSARYAEIRETVELCLPKISTSQMNILPSSSFPINMPFCDQSD